MRKLVVVVCFFYAAATMAADKPLALPDALKYKEKPIEPYCMEALVSMESGSEGKKIDLRTCGRPSDIVIDKADLPIKPPLYGYSYMNKGDEGASQSYVGYQYYGMAKDLII